MCKMPLGRLAKFCIQTVLPDRSLLTEQKLVENTKMLKIKCGILSNFQTMCGQTLLPEGQFSNFNCSRGCVTRTNSRASSIASSGGSPRTPNSPSRPQLRRESAQDLGDQDPFDHSSKFKFCFTSTCHQPPDLKIDLLTDSSR